MVIVPAIVERGVPLPDGNDHGRTGYHTQGKRSPWCIAHVKQKHKLHGANVVLVLTVPVERSAVVKCWRRVGGAHDMRTFDGGTVHHGGRGHARGRVCAGAGVRMRMVAERVLCG